MGSWNSWSWRWNPWLMAAQGLRGAAARPGAVHRLRTGLHPARLGRVGRTAVRRPDGGHRCGVRASAHRRDPHRRDGRLVRRLHGQLDRRSHQPFRRDRDPCQPVGARPIRSDHRHRVLLAPRDDAADDRRQFAPPFRRQHQHTDAGHPRRQGLPRADRRGPATLVRTARLVGAAGRRRTAAARTGSCISRPRTTGSLAPQHTKIWYEVVLAFLAEHVLGESAEWPEMLGVPSRP